MDVLCLISNCPQLNNPCNAYNPTPIRLLVWDAADRGLSRHVHARSWSPTAARSPAGSSARCGAWAIGVGGGLLRGRRQRPARARWPTRRSPSGRRRRGESYLRRRARSWRRPGAPAPRRSTRATASCRENAEFAARCEAAGHRASSARRPSRSARFGLKHPARELAVEPAACRCCRAPACWPTSTRRAPRRPRIGYPVMLKSTAGGGGIGMRVCRDAAELSDAFETVAAPGAAATSSDGGVYLETLRRARAPRRGADLRRRRGRRAGAGRARLLDPAAQPEGDRGDARARAAARGAPARCSEARCAWGAAVELPLGRHGRVRGRRAHAASSTSWR